MPAKLIQIDSVDHYDALIDESFDRPVLLLKHSSTCGTSADILYQLQEIDAEIKVIVVQQSRPLSNHVAEKLGHRHHSPQAFIIDKGQTTYHATHYGINRREIESKLAVPTALATV